MKKNLGFLLAALAMTLALAIPAFASGSSSTTTTTLSSGGAVDVAAVTVAPTIQMVAPTGVVIGLNPYGMVYDGSNTFLKNLKNVDAQILSAPAVVENKSNVKVSVSAKATATVSGGVVLVSGDAIQSGGAFPQDNFDKGIYLTMQLGKSDKTGAWAGGNVPTEAVFTDNEVNYKDAILSGSILSGGPSGDWFIKSGSSLLAFTPDASTGVMEPLILPAMEGKTSNYFAFKFAGYANDHADPGWTTADKVSVSVVFTFKPVK